MAQHGEGHALHQAGHMTNLHRWPHVQVTEPTDHSTLGGQLTANFATICFKSTASLDSSWLATDV